MDKKDFIIDLDSTLNCLDERWLEVYNKDYNDNLIRKDMVRWETHTVVKPECGMKIYDYLLQPNFFRTLDVKPDAPEVTKWMQEYFNLYIVTAYTAVTCKDKVDWMQEHFPHIPSKNIIFCNPKHIIKADFILDDGGHNILDFAKTNPDGLPIIFDAPWNEYLCNYYLRVTDWKDVETILSSVIYGGLYEMIELGLFEWNFLSKLITSPK